MKTVAKLIAAALFALGTLSAQAQKEELKVTYPKPMFIGTKVKTVLPNLEPPGYKAPKIKVPAGTANVAKDKIVTSSDDEPIIGELELITDDDKDGADGSYVELGPGVQWVQIDLEKEHNIYAIALWHFHKNARAYKDVVIQLSNDPDFLKGVKTVFNNDHDNSAGKGVGRKDKAYVESNLGRVLEINGAKARYVRLYSNGSTANEMNHYIEVEVYGKPS